jgi:hypothetical protein
MRPRKMSKTPRRIAGLQVRLDASTAWVLCVWAAILRGKRSSWVPLVGGLAASRARDSPDRSNLAWQVAKGVPFAYLHRQSSSLWRRPSPEPDPDRSLSLLPDSALGGGIDLRRQKIALHGRQPSAERLVLASPRSAGDERADGRLRAVGRRLDVLIRDSRGAPDDPLRRARTGARGAGHVLRTQSSDPASLDPAPKLLLRTVAHGGIMPA